jgi:hypothetical protein
MDEVRCCGPVSSFYDPTTGTFLTRDPLVSLTREAYSYVGGNRLNRTDPSGLWAWDGYCMMNINCGEGATPAGPVAEAATRWRDDHPEVAQGIADTSGGVLNGLTLGNAKNFAGIRGRVELTRFVGHPILGVVPGEGGPDGSSSEVPRGVPA